MPKRKLEELNLLDDFLFGKMMTYPGIGEQFARDVLKIIFGKSFDRLTVISQKVYYGNDTDKHGARLDVYLEEASSDETTTENAVVYDIEPDKNSGKEERSSLPQRTRFYHSVIDSECLDSGKGFHSLKKVVVVMITPYDPFDQDYMMYTIKNHCEELPDLPYDDGARTLFLYTKGKKGQVSQELRQFLKYMEETTEENADTEVLQDIQKMVRQVKQDREVTLEYMKVFEWEERLKRQAQKEGWEEGHAAGLAAGHAAGLAEGHAETERERQRADLAELELQKLQKELDALKAMTKH